MLVNLLEGQIQIAKNVLKNVKKKPNPLDVKIANAKIEDLQRYIAAIRSKLYAPEEI